MPVFQIHGLDYAYGRWGEPDAPAVFLIQGLGMPKEAWPQPLVETLVARGYQVIAPDNRDAGASSRMTDWHVTGADVARAIGRALLRRPVVGEYALEDMALDALRLLDELGIRRAHVAGVSMGGMIAQTLAVQSPNRVATLTSISSASGNPRTGLGKFGTIWSILRPRGKTPREQILKTLRVLSGPAYPVTEDELNRYLEQLPNFDRDLSAVFRQVVALLSSGDRSEQLRRIRAPTLVVHGTADPLLPFSAGRETAELIPGAELWAVEGMGHQLPWTFMETLGARMAAFMNRYPV